MRILHTSDWHLGKKLYKKDRTPEHELFLNWLTKTIKDQKVEVLVIAGDIFDTPIPTTESLSLFFKFLKDLEELQNFGLKKVLILAGNHDSAKLLESPRPFLNRNFTQVVGTLNPPSGLSDDEISAWQNQYRVSLVNSAKKEFHFSLLPFFRTREILNMPWVATIKEENPDIAQDELILESLKNWVTTMTTHQTSRDSHHVLVSHHVFGSFMASGSEQGVALSGIDSLPLSLFLSFEVLLLGHIHKKQVLRKEPIALYCGSPLPLRFSETNHKSVFLVEHSEESWNYQEIDIPVFRPLLRVASSVATYKEDIKIALGEFSFNENPLSAYLELTLEMEAPTSGLLEEIREHLKDLPVELVNYFTTIERVEDDGNSLNLGTITNKSTTELFELYLDTFELTDEHKKNLSTSFKELLTLQQSEKEGNSL